MSKPFAVFDIDGTLVRWQLYHAVVDKLAAAGLLGTGTHKDLLAARARWKKREHDQAFSDYEHFLVERYEQALPTLDPKTFDRMVQEVIEEYKDQVYTYTKQLIAKLKAQGYVLLAISGSHQELVTAIADHYQFDDFIGSVYEREGQKFSGKKRIATADKAAALKQFITKHNLTIKGSYAVGDSLSDASMLAMVENPIAFNPDQALLTRAKQEQWKIVLERKNVTYELEPRDGSYILA